MLVPRNIIHVVSAYEGQQLLKDLMRFGYSGEQTRLRKGVVQKKRALVIEQNLSRRDRLM